MAEDIERMGNMKAAGLEKEVLVVLDEVAVVRLDDRRCSTSCSKETGQMLKRAKEATWAGQGGSGLFEMFDILQF